MWLGRAEKRHARLLACPVSWRYDLGWHSMITGSWPAASVNRIWLIHILYFSTSHTYTLEYKSVLFSFTLRCHVGAWRDIWKNDSKTLDSRKNTHHEWRESTDLWTLFTNLRYQRFTFWLFLANLFHFFFLVRNISFPRCPKPQF